MKGSPSVKEQRQVFYDFALSFAGEQRDYVERVAIGLALGGKSVFYDRYETTELWGEKLNERLPRVYRDLSRYVIAFVSADYAAKAWPKTEFEKALEAAVRMRRAYILPVRFDSTSLPGLDEDIHYLKASECTPEEIALRAIGKIAQEGNPPTSNLSSTETAPRGSWDVALFHAVHEGPAVRALNQAAREN